MNTIWADSLARQGGEGDRVLVVQVLLLPRGNNQLTK